MRMREEEGEGGKEGERKEEMMMIWAESKMLYFLFQG